MRKYTWAAGPSAVGRIVGRDAVSVNALERQTTRRPRRPVSICKGVWSHLEKVGETLCVEQPADGESSGHRLVAWVVRHCSCPCGKVSSLSI